MKCWDGCVQIQLQNRLWARLAWLQSADPALSEAHAPGSQSEVLEAVCQQMFNPQTYQHDVTDPHKVAPASFSPVLAGTHKGVPECQPTSPIPFSTYGLNFFCTSQRAPAFLLKQHLLGHGPRTNTDTKQRER